MESEIVAKYYFCPINDVGEVTVYAYYESSLDMQNRNVSHYDIYDKYGRCMNEGDPFYQFPTWETIFDEYYMPTVN